jgi:hypothetical protein
MSVDLLQLIGVSAVVSGCVTAGTQFWINRRFLDYQLRKQHEQDERRKLRELISTYKGRMLEAALDWDRRAAQLYDGHYDDLCPPRERRLDHEQYYFQSVVFRFLQLMAISRRFEGEAFYIEPSIAEEKDFDLLRYAKGFLWVAIHAEITPDDGLPGIDHFRSDALRPLLDVCYSESAKLPKTRSKQGELIFDRRRCMTLLERSERLGVKEEVDEVLGFFDGLRPEEYDERNGGRRQRRRWDRVVALHLFVLAFIGRCGYRENQRDIASGVDAATQMLLYPDELSALFEVWLPRLGLTDESMTNVRVALNTAARRTSAETEQQRTARVVSAVSSRRDARRGAAALVADTGREVPSVNGGAGVVVA